MRQGAPRVIESEKTHNRHSSKKFARPSSLLMLRAFSSFSQRRGEAALPPWLKGSKEKLYSKWFWTLHPLNQLKGGKGGESPLLIVIRR